MVAHQICLPDLNGRNVNTILNGQVLKPFSLMAALWKALFAKKVKLISYA